MKRKIFIAIYTLSIVLAVGLLNFIVVTVKKSDGTPSSSEEEVDRTLAQLIERPNSAIMSYNTSTPFFLLPLLYPEKDTYPTDCSLRFSYAPKTKAIEPNATVDYTITISNQGKDTCKNVSLSLYYTEKESYVSSDPAPAASDYYWDIGDLGFGKSYAIKLSVRITGYEGEATTSEGCVTADNSQDICAQNVIFTKAGASKSTTLAGVLAVPKAIGAIWGRIFEKKEFGIWVWDSPIKMTPVYAQQVLGVAKKNGFNVIYLTIDDYVPIAAMKNPDEQVKAKAAYMKTLSIFIQAAKSSGIAVDVEGGAKEWAIKDNRWKGYALIDFVKHYNDTYPNAKIHGLQYDVEPYLMQDYDSNKVERLREYVEFIDESARRMQGVDAQFSIVIPHFYDSQQKWTPAFKYNGREAYAYTHLLEVLKQKNGTSIIIMAYRNFFDGGNGTRQISEEEIKEASESGYDTKIIVAQETGDVPPSYVTFHDYPKVSLFDSLAEIQSNFSHYEDFGGTAVHYFDAFVKMD
jgi:hypothetical protein